MLKEIFHKQFSSIGIFGQTSIQTNKKIIDMPDITYKRLGRFPKNLNLIPSGKDKMIGKTYETKSSFKSASARHYIHGSHIRY